MKLHETHHWRYSDSSLYDAVCTQCNHTDTSPQAEFPCGNPPAPSKFLELAMQAGLKARSELKLSPQEQKFAELIVKYCGQFTDPNTRKFLCKEFDIEQS